MSYGAVAVLVAALVIDMCLLVLWAKPSNGRRNAVRRKVRALRADVPLGFFELRPAPFVEPTMRRLAIEGQMLLERSPRRRCQ